MAHKLEHDLATYNAATLAAVVFLAPYAVDGYSAILVWVIPTYGKFEVEQYRAVRTHMAELCSNAAFADRHNVLSILLSADTDGDVRRSREMQASLVSWKPESPHIPFR